MSRYGLTYTWAPKPCTADTPKPKVDHRWGLRSKARVEQRSGKFLWDEIGQSNTKRECAYGLYTHICVKSICIYTHTGRYLGNTGRWWGCFKGNKTLSNYTSTAHRAGTAVCRLKGSRCAHVRIPVFFFFFPIPTFVRQVFFCYLLRIT